MEQTTIGGGCFWCLEAVFQEVDGVNEVVSGYAGGHVRNPTYREVCYGRTGHAEVVQVTSDPEKVSFREVLEIFFAIHDPTTPDRQGADVGPQYRSIILYHNDEQREQAEQMMQEMSAARIWPDPIVTQLEPLNVFYPAEDYHQDYFRNNPGQPYCQAVINPKLKKFRETFVRKQRA